jgi:hypothetical protein
VNAGFTLHDLAQPRIRLAANDLIRGAEISQDQATNNRAGEFACADEAEPIARL